MLISIAVPIDRAINYFRFLTAFLSVLTITSILGISIFLINTGFNPHVFAIFPEDPSIHDDKICERPKIYIAKTWIDCGYSKFSVLTLCGVIMMSVFLLPIILRPIDFIKNF